MRSYSKVFILALLMPLSNSALAQTGTFSTITIHNSYTNTITSCLYSANPRSGFVFQSNGSLNFGMVGPINYNFKFRWLAHDNSAVNYDADADQLMYLTSYGDLWLKRSFIMGGNLLIGKTSQTNTSYRLDVNGNIRASKVVVNTTGADYAFDSAYYLMPLDSLKRFIERNHHLPGIPSAAEMSVQGADLGDLYTKMLEKMENMTQYIISQSKLIDDQKRELDSLKNRLE